MSKNYSNKSNPKNDCDVFADVIVKCIQTQDLDLKLKCATLHDILGTTLLDTYVKCKLKDVN